MRRMLMMAAAAGLVAAGAGAAVRGGGADIASAPELPLGQQVQGGAPHSCSPLRREFWRLTLLRGDHVRLDLGSLNGHTVYVIIYAPDITDYTLNGATQLASVSTTTKNELTYIAPAPGRYTLLVGVGDCSYDLAYILTGYIQHYTSTSVTTPPLVETGKPFTVSGAVSGATSGNIEIRFTTAGQPTVSGTASITNSGAFQLKQTLNAGGQYKVQAIYHGDGNHLQSAASTQLRADYVPRDATSKAVARAYAQEVAAWNAHAWTQYWALLTPRYQKCIHGYASFIASSSTKTATHWTVTLLSIKVAGSRASVTLRSIYKGHTRLVRDDIWVKVKGHWLDDVDPNTRC
jgi:hypothetical protein